MNQTRSYAVKINDPTQPQRRPTPLNAGFPSIPYAAPQPRWISAIQKFDGTSYLLSIPLHDRDSTEQAFVREREQLSKVSRQKYHERCISMLITKTVVGTARVKQIMACDLDPHIRYRASLQDHEHEPLLTEIFHKSTHLTVNNHTFPGNFNHVEDCQGKRIIVIRKVLDKFKIAMLLILLLLISPALGTVVAAFIHHTGVEVAVSAGVGVAVSAAIFALASFLQALATWLET